MEIAEKITELRKFLKITDLRKLLTFLKITEL